MEELKHHGVIGMKWGVRRYQNKDGSLTSAGKRREARLNNKMADHARKYNALKSQKLVKKKTSNSQEEKDDLYKRKNTNKMSDAELREKTNRLNLENNYNIAMDNYQKSHPKQISKGKAFVNTIKNDILIPAAKDVAKTQVKNYMNRVLEDMINNNLSKNKK